MGRFPTLQQQNRMLTFRHKTTLFVLLRVPSSPIHNYSFLFAETEFGTRRTNKPSSHFVFISNSKVNKSPAPWSPKTTLHSVLALGCKTLPALLLFSRRAAHTFCMRQQETHSMSKFIRKSQCCRNNYADAGYFRWFWSRLKLTPSMISSY